jgi:anaerobic selenocysteine-containing dehydrogenase
VNRPNPPLQVIGFVGTKRGDADRGPAFWLNTGEAGSRSIDDGELVWVYGPRRHELAVARINDEIPRGSIVVRDIAGVAISEIVRLVKVDTDRPILHADKALA